MRKRWEEEKRAWIFYVEEIQKDPDMVYGATEEAEYFLDCETAHLFIWAKKMNILTEFGISRLLEKLNGMQDGTSQGTRILYKGIILQPDYNKSDAELLEYIDLKGDIKKEYININRNAFTEQGYRFFEEKVYPELMRIISAVLKDMEESAEKQLAAGDDSFSEKIEGKLKEKCDEIRLQNIEERKVESRLQEIISLVASASMLSYYAMRSEWNIWDGFQVSNKSGRIWQELLRKIDRILREDEKILAKLKMASPLFRIQAQDERHKLVVNRGRSSLGICFHEIFLEENHWAILQQRESLYSPWVQHLICLDERTGDEPSMYERLFHIPRMDENLLEKWADELCDVSRGFLEMADYSQQILLKWMLKNLPTIGLFCTPEGNVRVNILGSRILPSIYVNQNFKLLLLERMIEKAVDDGTERFSMILWQNREYIGVKVLPYSIYFIRRGYMAPYTFRKGIVPLRGSWIRFWKKKMEEENGSSFEQIEKLLENMDIDGFYKRLATKSRRWNVHSWDKQIYDTASFLLQDMVEFGTRSSLKEYELEELLKCRDEWELIYMDVLQFCTQSRNEKENSKYVNSEEMKLKIDSIQGTEEFQKLCFAWHYVSDYNNQLLKNLGRAFILYKEFEAKNVNFTAERMNFLSYLAEHSVYGSGRMSDMQRIKEEVQLYERELLDLMEELEKKKISEMIEKFKIRYTKLMSSLSKRLLDVRKNTEDDDN